MASLTTRVRGTLFGLVILAALASGASAARAAVSMAPIFDSAEECRAYCNYLGKPNMSWDPNTGACRCW
ncbi:MAG TPA: hypothetical protein VHG93_26985 [Longimicrobium sp.]|nr:hypothetical protein [Longimicrobium sp.]